MATQSSAGYFIPAPADRCIVALRKWLAAHAHVPGPLPPAETVRATLLDRWTQHTSHCVHCQAAFAGIAKWRGRTNIALALSLLVGVRFWPARLLGVLCLGLLRLYALAEQQFKFADYKHYLNN